MRGTQTLNEIRAMQNALPCYIKTWRFFPGALVFMLVLALLIWMAIDIAGLDAWPDGHRSSRQPFLSSILTPQGAVVILFVICAMNLAFIFYLILRGINKLPEIVLSEDGVRIINSLYFDFGSMGKTYRFSQWADIEAVKFENQLSIKWLNELIGPDLTILTRQTGTIPKTKKWRIPIKLLKEDAGTIMEKVEAFAVGQV